MNATLVFISGVMYMAAWLVREWQWSKERDKWDVERTKMVDRLMAKSLPEFKYEERKEEVLKKKAAVVAKPSPTDAEMAEWERRHDSQVAENNAEIDAKVAELRRKAVSGVETRVPAGVDHGS